MPRTRRVENLRHGARTTTAGTREGTTITATASRIRDGGVGGVADTNLLLHRQLVGSMRRSLPLYNCRVNR